MNPVRVYLSHAPEDGPAVAQVLRHLSPLPDVVVAHPGAIPPGAPQAQTSAEHIDRAQLVLLFISADALADAPCQAEWRRALARRAAGHAVVIPVALRSAYVPSPVWADLCPFPADGQPLLPSSHLDARLADLARVVYEQAQQLQDLAAPAPPEAPPLAPVVLPPPHAAYDPSWYIARGAAEQKARDALGAAGYAVLLYGPERCGKTWLLRHLLATAREPGDQVVVLNLDLCDPDTALTSLPAFLRELALQIADPLGVEPAAVDRAFARPGTPVNNFDWLMRRDLLPGCPGRLFLCIERADAALAAPFRNNFFGLLRGWAEKNGDPPFDRLRMVLCVSTTPQLLVPSVHQSPFNIDDAIELPDLTPPEAEDLLGRHRLRWTADEWTAARRLVGGHPYLLRVLMYAARRQGRPLAGLLDDEAVFAAHLDRYRRALRKEEPLRRVLAAIAGGAALAPEDDDALHRLRRAGLIGGPHERPTLRYELYRRLVPAT